MLCQNCGENEANVKYTQIINGVKKQMVLCDKCAKSLGVEDIHFNMPISFSNFLGDMFNEFGQYDNMQTLLNTNDILCPKCNMSYDEFVSNGKIGCDECYNTFQDKIDQILKNIHGVNNHIGRNGNVIESMPLKNKEVNNEKEEKKQENKLEQLKEQLKQEIKEERYEDAAKTRDEIKKLI